MSDRAMLSPWASVRAEELTQLIAAEERSVGDSTQKPRGGVALSNSD